MRLDVSIRHGWVNLQHYPELIPLRVVNVLSVMRKTISVFHLRAKTKIVKLLQNSNKNSITVSSLRRSVPYTEPNVAIVGAISNLEIEMRTFFLFRRTNI